MWTLDKLDKLMISSVVLTASPSHYVITKSCQTRTLLLFPLFHCYTSHEIL